MTLVSRDQMPPRTPYEAELRERLARAERQALTYQRVAALQDAVVSAAREVVAAGREIGRQLDPMTFDSLAATLALLDREVGAMLLESMPAELREALKTPSAFEEVLKTQKGELARAAAGKKDGG